MGRKPRNYYAGGVYHIIHRGNNKTFIFDDQLDKGMFYKMIREVMNMHPFYVLYFVFMDNHYHMIVEMIDTDMSLIMKKIHMSYSKYYNKKYNRTDTIFGSKYTSIPVTDNQYFLQLIYYIAHNPVKAGVAKGPFEYKWCAHNEIVSNTIDGIVDRNQMLSKINKNESLAVESYLDFLNQNNLEKIVNSNTDESLSKKRQEMLQVILFEHIKDVTFAEKLRTKDRSPRTLAAKKEFVAKAKSKGFKHSEIAEFLNMTSRSIRNIASS